MNWRRAFSHFLVSDSISVGGGRGTLRNSQLSRFSLTKRNVDSTASGEHQTVRQLSAHPSAAASASRSDGERKSGRERRMPRQAAVQEKTRIIRKFTFPCELCSPRTGQENNAYSILFGRDNGAFISLWTSPSPLHRQSDPLLEKVMKPRRDSLPLFCSFYDLCITSTSCINIRFRQGA